MTHQCPFKLRRQEPETAQEKGREWGVCREWGEEGVQHPSGFGGSRIGWGQL